MQLRASGQRSERRSWRTSTVRSLYQGMTEETAEWKDLVCDLYSAEMSDGAIIKYSHELCVKVVKKSNLQSKPCLQSHTYKWQYKENVITITLHWSICSENTGPRLIYLQPQKILLTILFTSMSLTHVSDYDATIYHQCSKFHATFCTCTTVYSFPV
jgi:hypothetical protein